jgi:hypothetical protein
VERLQTTVFSTNEHKTPQGATRPARLDLDWDRDRKGMTSGREKPDFYWVDICWTLFSKNMSQTILVVEGSEKAIKKIYLA